MPTRFLGTRRYLALVKRRPIYQIQLSAVITFAIILLVIGRTHFLWGPDELTNGFGEAFLIAGVLAGLVDPVVQAQFATDWGRDLYWAIFSPNAPLDFRDALQGLASPDGYLDRVKYELDFTRVDEPDTPGYLNVSWGIWTRGTVLDRRGYLMHGQVVVVSRHDGKPSQYVYWSFESGDRKIAKDTAKLASSGALSVDSSGRTVLDQKKLRIDSGVPFQGNYAVERHIKTSRWMVDFLPLFQPRVALRQTIVIKGSAVPGLEFSVTQVGASNELTLSPDAEDQNDLSCEITQVAFPGQTTLVQWKPRTEPSHPT
ncbi:hypothetical protein [Nocardia alni]|uniref:hypothetical protein n=1 Tax=Nocardia alni TaxID=2815723 RepID=UPI001C21C6CF|nr:hypothetical protein [Nocardia alni]